MRVTRKFLTAVVAAAVFTLSILVAVPAAKAVGPDNDRLIRDGKLVSMTSTTVTVKEWAGTYTYRLSPTGRQALDALGIGPGDAVQFTADSPWGIAHDFHKLSGLALGG